MSERVRLQIRKPTVNEISRKPQSRQAAPAAPSRAPLPAGYGHNFRSLAVFPKLQVNTPGDRFEQEADGMADRVMRMNAPEMAFASSAAWEVQRKCADCEREEEEARKQPAQPEGGQIAGPLKPSAVAGAVQHEGERAAETETQAKPDMTRIAIRAATRNEDEEERQHTGRPPAVQRKGEEEEACGKGEEEEQRGKGEEEEQRGKTEALETQERAAPDSVQRAIQSGGQPLDREARAFMEPRFGYDFSRVRVHNDALASQSAEAIQARAYTVGQDVVFRSGEYAPGTETGKRLLAHELTHVVQQGAAATRVQRDTPPLAPSTPAPAPGAAPGPSGPPPAKVSVAGGASAHHAMSECDWGWTDTETVDSAVVASKYGTDWKAVVTTLLGHYSVQTRLLPSEQEVTGPGGNTTQATYKDQVKELNALGFCKKAPSKWYMLQAVVSHENVHVAHLLPALQAAAPKIQQEFFALSVADAGGKTADQALTEIKALPGYQAAMDNAVKLWDAEFTKLIAGDHKGPAAAAEHGVVDPMIAKICAEANNKGWDKAAECP